MIRSGGCIICHYVHVVVVPLIVAEGIRRFLPLARPAVVLTIWVAERRVDVVEGHRCLGRTVEFLHHRWPLVFEPFLVGFSIQVFFRHHIGILLVHHDQRICHQLDGGACPLDVNLIAVLIGCIEGDFVGPHLRIQHVEHQIHVASRLVGICPALLHGFIILGLVGDAVEFGLHHIVPHLPVASVALLVPVVGGRGSVIPQVAFGTVQTILEGHSLRSHQLYTAGIDIVVVGRLVGGHLVGTPLGVTYVEDMAEEQGGLVYRLVAFLSSVHHIRVRHRRGGIHGYHVQHIFRGIR